MAQEKQEKQSPNPLKAVTEAARSKADSAESRNGSTPVQGGGPFEVGKIGHVAVVERELGEETYTYAEFTGSGRPSRIPLAAVSVLAEKLA